MALSFEDIINMPVDEISAPPLLPNGTYHCIVDGTPEVIEAKTGTKGYVVKARVVAPIQVSDMGALAKMNGANGKVIYQNFYLTENNSYIFVKFLVNDLGIPANGRGIKELVPEAQGKEFAASIQSQPTQPGSRSSMRSEVVGTAHL